MGRKLSPRESVSLSLSFSLIPFVKGKGTERWRVEKQVNRERKEAHDFICGTRVAASRWRFRGWEDDSVSCNAMPPSFLLSLQIRLFAPSEFFAVRLVESDPLPSIRKCNRRKFHTRDTFVVFGILLNSVFM